MAKKRFEDKRVAYALLFFFFFSFFAKSSGLTQMCNRYDAAVQKLQGLKKQKNAKADKLKQSEDEVTTARSTLEVVSKIIFDTHLLLRAPAVRLSRP